MSLPRKCGLSILPPFAFCTLAGWLNLVVFSPLPLGSDDEVGGLGVGVGVRRDEAV